MKEVTVKDAALQRAATEGMDAYLGAFVNAINEVVGETLTTESMALLNADQITLLAYMMLRDEVTDGGFVQLIHNGYGSFFFHNPFAKVMRIWGIDGLCRLINKARRYYYRYHEAIERDCSDEDFMALFEQFPDFDDLDDEFVANEEEWTAQIAAYVDEHADRFATIEK